MTCTLTVDYATSALSRGKRGTLGVLRCPDGSLEFMGLGTRAPIIKLWASFQGSFWDETTFSHQLICRKGKGARIAWGVLTKENWDQIWTSSDLDRDLYCIAVIDSTKKDVDDIEIPLCLKIRFSKEIAAVAVVRDAEVCKLWVGEGNELRDRFSMSSGIHTPEKSEVNTECENRFGMC